MTDERDRHSELSWPSALGSALGAWASARWLTGAVGEILYRGGLSRSNRDGRRIPTAVGLVPVTVGLGAAQVTPGGAGVGWVIPAAVGALAGLVDDAAGRDGGPRGWRGHWKSLQEGRPSTGILKAGAVALAAGSVWASALRREGLGRSLLAAMSTVLTANLVNQLDTAPGRAGSAFLGGMAALGVMAERERRRDWAGALPLAAAVAGYLPADRRADVMLGDSGANALGATLGWVCGACLPTAALATWTVGVGLAGVILDRWSLSEWLQGRQARRRPVSRWVTLRDGNGRRPQWTSPQGR